MDCPPKSRYYSHPAKKHATLYFSVNGISISQILVNIKKYSTKLEMNQYEYISRISQLILNLHLRRPYSYSPKSILYSARAFCLLLLSKK